MAKTKVSASDNSGDISSVIETLPEGPIKIMAQAYEAATVPDSPDAFMPAGKQISSCLGKLVSGERIPGGVAIAFSEGGTPDLLGVTLTQAGGASLPTAYSDVAIKTDEGWRLTREDGARVLDLRINSTTNYLYGVFWFANRGIPDALNAVLSCRIAPIPPSEPKKEEKTESKDLGTINLNVQSVPAPETPE